MITYKNIIQTITVLLITTIPLCAQVFKQDFGAGYDTVAYDWIARGLKPLLTIYHCPPGKPNDGCFVITANTGQMFQESSCDNRQQGDLFYEGWHKTLQDHTIGDENGRFLLVNTAFFDNEIFQKSIDKLEVGKSYQFSIWVANLFNAAHIDKCYPDSPVNIVIEIYDGARLTPAHLLTQLQTGDVVSQDSISDLWKNFKTTFKAKSSNCVIVIKNNKSAGCGNDLAIDDLVITEVK